MVPPGFPPAVHLRLIQPVVLDPARARPFFGTSNADWLGSPVDPPVGNTGAQRYLTDLSLPVRERAPLMVFRKAAFVDVGPSRPVDGGFQTEIGWRSATLAPLFPVFAGHLTVLPGELRLEGYYAPPGGEVGLVLDRAFLNIAARGTARWFLGHVTETLHARAGALVRGRMQASADDSAEAARLEASQDLS